MSQALSFRGKIMSDLDIVSNYRKGKLPITKKTITNYRLERPWRKRVDAGRNRGKLQSHQEGYLG